MNTDTYLLGIDPGSTFIGFSLMRIDSVSLAIRDTDAFTINLKKSPYYPKWLTDYQDDRYCRISALEEEFFTILNTYHPCLVASESPFFDRSKPTAFAVLVEVLNAIKRVLMKYDSTYPLMLVEPSLLKKSVGVQLGKYKKGMKQKDMVRDAVLQLSNINCKRDMSKLDEHSIDAIGAVYSAYLSLKGNI